MTPSWFSTSLRRCSLVLFCAVMLARCAPVEGQTPVPDDGRDDAAAIQAAIDTQAAKGTGVVQLEAGTYNMSHPVFLRDGVTLAGRGPATRLTNAGFNGKSTNVGAIVFAGNIAPVSYTGVVAPGFPGRPAVREGDRLVSVTGCDVARMPQPGTVIWLSSTPVSKARRDAPTSRYGEINLVTSAEGCTLGFDAPVSAPLGERIWIHWSDGSVDGPKGVPQRTIREAGLRDLALSSMSATALEVSGCYRCSFTDLTIERSRRLVGLQGTRGSLYENISGTFIERGIEVAMYATENTVRNIVGQYSPAPGWQARPAIRFGEFANDNKISQVRLQLGPAYRGKIKIRFDESYNNQLDGIELDMPDEDNTRGAFGHRAEGAERLSLGALAPDTALNNVALCWPSGGTRRCAPVR
jgi:hypothetical protein